LGKGGTAYVRRNPGWGGELLISSRTIIKKRKVVKGGLTINNFKAWEKVGG